MKLGHLAVAMAMAATGPVMAANGCTKTFDLGTMGPPADKSFTSGYFQAANFKDCYDFTINSPATASGTTTEWNWNFGNLLGYMDVLGVQLFSTSGARTSIGSLDTTPASFSFGNLAAGTYELVISGTTTRGWLGTMVAYSGEVHTRAAQVAAPVPEPELFAMLALGLGAAGFAARRRRG